MRERGGARKVREWSLIIDTVYSGAFLGWWHKAGVGKGEELGVPTVLFGVRFMGFS